MANAPSGQSPFRRGAGIAALVALVLASRSAAAPAPETAAVELLRFPHPYRAAVTVCSDSHGASVERFEAVHTLVNTRAWIERDSSTWSLLFDDPAIDEEPRWSRGIRGFGLPMGDTIWLYGPSMAVFERFDASSASPVPHAIAGRDYRDIIDGWMRRGWIDALHTGGEGAITREAMRAGLGWLTEAPHRRLSVWVNHALHTAPSGIQPNVDPVLPIVLQNLSRLPFWALARAGAGDLARSLVRRPSPDPFPPGQAALLWSLSALLACGVVGLLLGLTVPRWRRWPVLVACLLAVGAIVGALCRIPHRYAQGDDPGTRFYAADLAREAGFRFYWMIGAGYPFVVEGRLPLPERSWEGRRSFLHLVELDDGSQVLAFPRAADFGYGGYGSLDMLTEEGLRNLVDMQGASVLYAHWLNGTEEVFDADGLRALARLQRWHQHGAVWVAPTSELLRHEYVRTFLDYTVRVQDGTAVIDVVAIRDPADGPFLPTVRDLRGIAFRVDAGLAPVLQIGGATVDADSVRISDSAAGPVLSVQAAGD